MTRRTALPRLAALLVLGIALSGVASAAESEKGHKAAPEKGEKAEQAEKFKLISAEQLIALRKAGNVNVYDANGDDFREKNGVIPGATLLTSFNKFDLSVLPKDKGAKLVFYCANSH